jgi:hypothetical protein
MREQRRHEWKPERPGPARTAGSQHSVSRSRRLFRGRRMREPVLQVGLVIALALLVLAMFLS